MLYIMVYIAGHTFFFPQQLRGMFVFFLVHDLPAHMTVMWGRVY